MAVWFGVVACRGDVKALLMTITRSPLESSTIRVRFTSLISPTFSLLSLIPKGDSNHPLEVFGEYDDFSVADHDDFIIDDFAPSSDSFSPTRPPRPSRPIRHNFARPPHPSEYHKGQPSVRNPRRFWSYSPTFTTALHSSFLLH